MVVPPLSRISRDFVATSPATAKEEKVAVPATAKKCVDNSRPQSAVAADAKQDCYTFSGVTKSQG